MTRIKHFDKSHLKDSCQAMLLASSRCSNCSAFVVHIYIRILAVGTFGIEFVLLFAPNGNQQVLVGNLCATAFLTLDQASTTIHHSHFFDGGCSLPSRQYPFAQSQQ